MDGRQAQIRRESAIIRGRKPWAGRRAPGTLYGNRGPITPRRAGERLRIGTRERGAEGLLSGCLREGRCREVRTEHRGLRLDSARGYGQVSRRRDRIGCRRTVVLVGRDFAVLRRIASGRTGAGASVFQGLGAGVGSLPDALPGETL